MTRPNALLGMGGGTEGVVPSRKRVTPSHKEVLAVARETF